ncbi:MFS transporter [Arcobacter sp. 15-2]|uniref:MFS transporter n=1 Tax=Arcobacter sp. 15-2 TaxID=3374109 RepID=UPI00399D1E67
MTYRELLKTHKVVRQLSAVQFIAYFGAWFTNVAIYSMLVKFGASPILIATVAAMHLIPGIVLSPFNGSIVDRIEVKKLMMILLSVELCMTLGFLLINSLNDVWLLLLLLFIRMGSASMFFTTEMSLLPKLLKGKALVKANEIHSIIWSFTFTAGMAIGGIIVSIFGEKISFLIDGVFFLTALVILSQIHFNVQMETVHKSIINSIRDGVLYIKENKHLLHYMLLHASVGLTAFDTLVTLLADYEYKLILAVPLAIGITNSVRAFALMIGPLLISNWVTKERLLYIFIIQGITIIIWAFIQNNFYLGLVGMFLTGIVTTTIWSYTYAMLQNQVEGKYLGRVLAYNEMVFMIANVTTTFFIGILATFVSLNIISILLGVVFLFVAYYYNRVFLKN